MSQTLWVSLKDLLEMPYTTLMKSFRLRWPLRSRKLRKKGELDTAAEDSDPLILSAVADDSEVKGRHGMKVEQISLKDDKKSDKISSPQVGLSWGKAQEYGVEAFDASSSAPVTVTFMEKESLWVRAEQLLREDDKKRRIWQASLDILEEEFGSRLQPTGKTDLRRQFCNLLDAKTRDLEGKKWSVRFGDHRIAVKDQLIRVFQNVLIAKDAIGHAANLSPPAAIACAGVTVVLSLVVQAAEQHAALLQGLESTSALISRLRVVEEIYLPRGSSQAAQFGTEFEETLTQLYAKILEFQARALCYLGKHSITQLLSDMFKHDGWDALVQEIDRLEVSEKRFADLLDAVEVEADGAQLTDSFCDLWEILTSVANTPSSGEVVCVFDALDECREADRIQFTRAVKHLFIPEPRVSNLKFLITSRPYEHIRRGFWELEAQLPKIHLSGENEVEIEKIMKEIDLVINERISQIGKQKSLEIQECEFLQEQLTSIPNRTYLWVSLVIDVIENTTGFTKGDVRRAIQSLPRTVDDAYEKILSHSPDIDKAKTLLHIVTAAKEPLSPKQVSLAMAISPEHRSYTDLEEELESEHGFRRTVRDLCGLLLVIIDEKIYLLHQTAKEFLVRDELLAPLSGLEVLVGMFLKDGGVDMNVKDPDFGCTPLSWAAAYGHEIVVKLLLHSGKVGPDSRDLEGKTPLSWAARRGHDKVVELLLGTGKVDPGSEDYSRNTPLSWAARGGHDKVVELLLDSGEVGPDFEVKSQVLDVAGVKSSPGHMIKVEETPLFLAADRGHDTVVKLLLDTVKFDPNFKYDLGLTLLSYAAQHGYEKVVRVLLDAENVDPESKDMLGRTPLSLAAMRGQESVVNLLITSGRVDPDSRDYKGRTPLSLAAMHGYGHVIKQLYDTGRVDPDSRDNDGRTPLSYAAARGHERALMQLYNTGKVNPDFRQDRGRTPLSFAAESGHGHVIKQLCATGRVNPDSRDIDGRTPLSYAAEADWGAQTAINCLLEVKRPNCVLLSHAAADERRRQSALKALLETEEVNVDSMDNCGRTPLSYAAAAKWLDPQPLEALLKTGKVNVESMDEDGRTPLSYAVEGWKKLPDELGGTIFSAVEPLLETGKVNIKSKDKHGRTPLSYAEGDGREALRKLLMDALQSKG
ncbi:hypothetical protein APSETT445_005101 [Aspergillus pseudonomiae]